MTKDNSWAKLLQKDAPAAARELIGWELYNRVGGQLIGGRIVEAEAYTQEDPASHTYRGRTTRNAPMFQASGTLYIYFTYGMHWCMNLVTGPKGHGEAVLIRGLEPLKGIKIMEQNRGTADKSNLCNGPAKLVQALQIDPSWSGKTLSQTTLILRPGQPPAHVAVSPRVGITQGLEKLWRFTSK